MAQRKQDRKARPERRKKPGRSKAWSGNPKKSHVRPAAGARPAGRAARGAARTRPSKEERLENREFRAMTRAVLVGKRMRWMRYPMYAMAALGAGSGVVTITQGNLAGIAWVALAPAYYLLARHLYITRPARAEAWFAEQGLPLPELPAAPERGARARRR